MSNAPAPGLSDAQVAERPARVGSIREGGWRVTVHADRSVVVAAEGSRWDAAQVLTMTALGGVIPEPVLDRVRLLDAWSTGAPEVDASAAVDLARLNPRERATLAASQTYRDGPVLPLLAIDPAPYVRAAVAIALGREAHAPRWFAVLGDDPDRHVRAAVAFNPHAPQALHAALAEDADPAVALAAHRNPTLTTSAPPPSVAAAPSGQALGDLMWLTPVWLDLVVTTDWQVRRELATRRDAPGKALEKLGDLGETQAYLTLRDTTGRGWD